ncbi:tripartite motif-containing protein 16-like [Chanos chanos]|uniref:Tripartite motif-containing protein 16-like n=1 Tax=Chanos chanos TaxID=29144 RepID=A0A6J2VQG3_CHACN|nr:tripartite motif-containing protein 16-like [Chanos chanos]
MAEASISVCKDQFMCPVCLDLFKDPVTIPCGHSYCMGCIRGYWGQDDQKGVYSCPQCRQNIRQRPVLRKNTILAEVMEKLKRTRLQGAAVPPDDYSNAPGVVECDFCTRNKEKAVKTCLTCLASFCQIHLQPHYESSALQKHTLVKASTRLQDKICSRHNKLIELWCQTDQQFMCYLCMVDEHRGHKTISVAAERTDREKQLGEVKKKTQQRIQEREKELQELRQTVESLRRSAQAAVEDSERIFTELICSIERRRREVTQLIRDQEKNELSQAERLLGQLEQEVADLRRRYAEQEQNFSSLSGTPGSDDLPSITFSPHLSFEDIGQSVAQLREQMEQLCVEEFGRLYSKVSNIKILPPLEPKTREMFLQYSCGLTLDPNTAHQYLCLSEGNRVAINCNKTQSYPDHPERFDGWLQVLCKESVSACCYWETEWSGDIGVYIAVSYKGIIRKGGRNESLFGYNDQSWSLICSPSSYSFWHNNKETKLSAVPSSSRIGVYVDHRAGNLSFYSVSDTMTLLHRVQTTFTQPLYPGFFVCRRSNLRLCHLPN